MYFTMDSDMFDVPAADEEVQEKLKRRALFNKHLSGAGVEDAAAGE